MKVEMGSPDDWRIDFGTYGGPYIREPKSLYEIAKVCRMHDMEGKDPDFAETQRRCYLLSAAPNMKAALRDLTIEVRGLFNAYEASMREAIGNTNYQCVLDKLLAANEALAKATPGGRWHDEPPAASIKTADRR